MARSPTKMALSSAARALAGDGGRGVAATTPLGKKPSRACGYPRSVYGQNEDGMAQMSQSRRGDWMSRAVSHPEMSSILQPPADPTGLVFHHTSATGRPRRAGPPTAAWKLHTCARAFPRRRGPRPCETATLRDSITEDGQATSTCSSLGKRQRRSWTRGRLAAASSSRRIQTLGISCASASSRRKSGHRCDTRQRTKWSAFTTAFRISP